MSSARRSLFGLHRRLGSYESSKGRKLRRSIGRDSRSRRLHLEPLEDRTLLSVGVGGMVWNDLNLDGIRDLDEPGAAGAVAEVFSSTDTVIGNEDDVSFGVAITDADGLYSFDDLPDSPNFYAVFRTPVGYEFTTQDAGDDDALDSDADAVGATSLFTIPSGQTDTTIDAGLVGESPEFGWALNAELEDQEQWIPYLPTPSQTYLQASTGPTGATVDVMLTFADAGYRVLDWGNIVGNGNTIAVNAQIEEWTGPAAAVITTVGHSYDLGALAPGTYTFTFMAWGNPVESVTFIVDTGPMISRVLVVEATGPRDGTLMASKSLLVTFNAVDPDGVASATVQVDGQNVTSVYGPYAAASGVNFGVPLGALSAGAHSYSIVATDNAGNPTSPPYTGTFDVLPTTGPTISHVVVAKAGTGGNRNGTLESSDNLVITWSATSDDGIASKSLTVDGQTVSTVYGPYGVNYAGVFGPLAAGVHDYTIEVTDTNGIASTHNGTFSVIAAASAAPRIDNVVVAETAISSRDGLLNTEETLVLTWTLTDADGIASKSLSVDGNTVATIYGPYGNAYAGRLGQLAAGTHAYTIQATDTTGQTSTLNGTFNVLAALTLEASTAPTGSTEALTGAELDSITAEAAHRLEAVFGSRVSTVLSSVSIQVVDLPGNLLGATTDGKILIDRDAAGYGWFVDPTPADDVEFAVQLDAYSLAANQDSPAVDRADLLTTVMHELGHVLGYNHADEGLMDDLLPLGTRRTDATDEVFGGYGE